METDNAKGPKLPPLPPKPAAAASPPPKPQWQDPAWWRGGNAPFVALLLAAVSCDFFFYGSDVIGSIVLGNNLGLAAALACFLFVAALLVVRRDYSRGEQCFLIGLALVCAAGLIWRGSLFHLAALLLISFSMQFFSSEFEVPEGRYRGWWSFWLARRSKAEWDIKGSCHRFRRFLPTCISVIIGGIAFVVFLCIFADGNPVVELVWNAICGFWNRLLSYLQLSWHVLIHAFYWLLGIASFAFFCLRRPQKLAAKLNAAVERVSGYCILPHLPLMLLLGVNIAFLIANAADIIFLWRGTAPEGVSQTAYLHNGAYSVIWAASLAALLLIVLFRRQGSARDSRLCKIGAYVLVAQTFLLACSVYLRLYNQIADCGFTANRILAAECLLLGLLGLGVLLAYMADQGRFWRYARICLAGMLLLILGFAVLPPAEMSCRLNLAYGATHPQWSRSDAGWYERMEIAGLIHDLFPSAALRRNRQGAAEAVEQRLQADRDNPSAWRHWTWRNSLDIDAAERILGRPLREKAVEPQH